MENSGSKRKAREYEHNGIVYNDDFLAMRQKQLDQMFDGIDLDPNDDLADQIAEFNAIQKHGLVTCWVDEATPPATKKRRSRFKNPDARRKSRKRAMDFDFSVDIDKKDELPIKLSPKKRRKLQPAMAGLPASLWDFRFEQLQVFKNENGVSKYMTLVCFGIIVASLVSFEYSSLAALQRAAWLRAKQGTWSMGIDAAQMRITISTKGKKSVVLRKNA